MEALVETPISVVASSAILPDDRLLEGWYLRGACRGLESSIFYPDPAQAAEEARALDVCSGCEVRSECLEHALARRESTGIWGGTTERDRRRILRRRRNA
jgi:WhiB family redox-sensing transcriptional regulator